MYPTPPPPQQRRNNYDHPHSDLEVVPDGADYDKTAVPSSPYSHHDKILVPQQPYYQKEVVEPNAYGVDGGGYNKSPAAAVAGSGNGDAIAALIAPPPTRREKILGLRRRTFFILVWIVSIALAIAIGVGAGVGASASRNNSSNAATTTGVREEITNAGAGPATPSPTTPPGDGGVQASPTTRLFTTTRLSTTTATTASPPPPVKTGGIGGRCSNQWGADCVCLDSGICRDVWRGTPYIGYEGNWPCPGDPANVMACVVKPCLGKAKGAQCLWREACREVDDGEFLMLGSGGLGFG